MPENVPDVHKDEDFVEFLEKIRERGKKDKRWKEYAEKFESINSEVAVPLEVHGNVIGVLNIHSTKKDAFTDDDKNTLYDLARLNATTIENVRLFVALRDISSTLIPSADQEDILGSIPYIVCNLMNTPACSIWILDRETKITIKKYYGLDADYVKEAVITLDDEITGKAIKKKEPVLIADIDAEKDKLRYYHDLKKMGYVALLSVPLIVGDEAIGTINIYAPATRAKQEFTEYELNLLRIFSIPAAAILNSAKLNQLREDIIESMVKISFESHDLSELLDEIVRIGRSSLEAKSCTIFLLDEDKETLSIRAGAGEIGKKLLESKAIYYVPKREPFETLEERRSKVDENYLKMKKKEKLLSGDEWKTRKSLVEKGKLPMGITAFVLKDKRPVMLSGDEVREHPEWFGGYEKKQEEACLSVVEIPLIYSDGAAEGVIKIENHIHDKFFTIEHKEILSILAKYIVFAIERVTRAPISYTGLYGVKLLEEIKSLKIGS